MNEERIDPLDYKHLAELQMEVRIAQGMLERYSSILAERYALHDGDSITYGVIQRVVPLSP